MYFSDYILSCTFDCMPFGRVLKCVLCRLCTRRTKTSSKLAVRPFNSNVDILLGIFDPSISHSPMSRLNDRPSLSNVDVISEFLLYPIIFLYSYSSCFARGRSGGIQVYKARN